MKILHISEKLIKASGISAFCAPVCDALAELGESCTVAVADPLAADTIPSQGDSVRRVSIDDVLEGRLGTDWDVVHVNALWSWCLHRAAVWARKNGIPVVWSPHGSLTPWALSHKRMKKIAGLLAYQYADLRRASFIHVTAQSEADGVRRLRLANRLVEAPLGVSPKYSHSELESIKAEPKPRRTLLFVSRVIRNKGLVHLVEAWRRLRDGGRGDVLANWHVRIVGPNEDNHREELEALVRSYGLEESFTFAGPIYGDALTREYAEADLFVLPSISENFGSVVIEALACETPVICTRGAPWRELESERCGWWIDIGADALVETLPKVLPLPNGEFRRMGVAGRALVDRKYAWSQIARTLRDAYRSVAQNSTNS